MIARSVGILLALLLQRYEQWRLEGQDYIRHWSVARGWTAPPADRG